MFKQYKTRSEHVSKQYKKHVSEHVQNNIKHVQDMFKQYKTRSS